MTIEHLIENVSYSQCHGSKEPMISNVRFKVDRIQPGDAFFALVYPGREGNQFSDGHSDIQKAIELGARLIVCERLPELLKDGVTYLQVANSFEAMGLMVANFYGNPARHLKVIGVTGTNGKTSVVTLLHELFRKLGRPAGLISTVVDKVNDEEIPTDGTTPNAIELNELWRKMVDAGCEYCFMEVTSHSIYQKRVAMVDFAGTVFTSLTADHIGYHKTFEEYVRVKKSLFDNTPASSFVVYNHDDPFGPQMVEDAVAGVWGISCKDPEAKLYFEVLQNSLQGLALKLGEHTIHSELAALFNAYNLISTYAVAVLLGEDPGRVIQLLPTLNSIPGRFNIVKSSDGKIGIVDFAHNLGALEKLYDLLEPMKTHRLITVIGCGGDRVRQRVKIGKLCYDRSDVLVLSSDNPRSEDPLDIVHTMMTEIEEGAPRAVIQVDRALAIRQAVEMAQPGDIVLLASKGHETYQEIKGVKHPFNDKAILNEEFQRAAKRPSTLHDPHYA